MTDAASIGTPSIALDETVASSATPGATTQRRTTVLPLVEMDGSTPRLVQQQGKPRYQPTKRLGEGGLGEVIGAIDNDIGRQVAMKRLRPDATSPVARARFVEEVRTIGRLEHPAIVPIHDVGVDEHGELYFVMKYVDGETLESIIDKLAAGDRVAHARFGFERRVQIFAALLEAVAFAHDNGVVHRDIKPANVMIGAHGEVLLMDWGIAKRIRDDGQPHVDVASLGVPPSEHAKRGALFETQAGELVGTPAYMSPEQARSEPVDERSDVYALSMLFHELLCLRHPLARKKTLYEMLDAVQHETVPMTGTVSSPHQPAVGMDLSWFVRKGLAKDPAKRYQSVDEMLERLVRRAEGRVPIQCHVTFVKRMNGEWNRFVDRHPLVLTIAMAAMLVAIIGLVVFVATHHGG